MSSTKARISKLDGISGEEREALVNRLLKAQNGLCYVCRKVVNPQAHKHDVDHIIALDRNGADDESKLGTHTRHLQSIRVHEVGESSKSFAKRFISPPGCMSSILK